MRRLRQGCSRKPKGILPAKWQSWTPISVGALATALHFPPQNTVSTCPGFKFLENRILCQNCIC